MNRIASPGLLLICAFLTCTGFAAEPLVVDLWPGKTPGDVGIKGQETSRIHQSPLVGPTKLITNVTKPTLTIYRPAEGQEHGNGDADLPGRRLLGSLLGARRRGSGGLAEFAGHDRHHPQVPCARGAPGMSVASLPLGPLLDAQRAVSLVRSRAAEWGIDPKRIGMVGFSAGGHLALATATSFEKRTYEPIDAIDEVSCRPDFAVLCYSGYLKAKDKDEISPGLHIPADTPPIFLAHANDDSEKVGGSNAEHSAFMYLALKRAGVPVELHIFATGNHDFGVRQNDKLPSSWPQLCVNWLRSLGLLKSSSRE